MAGMPDCGKHLYPWHSSLMKNLPRNTAAWLFTQGRQGDCNGVMWELNRFSQQLTGYFSVVAYAMVLFVAVEIGLIGLQIAYEASQVRTLIETVDLIVVGCTLFLVIAFAGVQAYSQHFAKKKR